MTGKRYTTGPKAPSRCCLNIIASNLIAEVILKHAIVALPSVLAHRYVAFHAYPQAPHLLSESEAEKEIHAEFIREVEQYVRHFTGMFLPRHLGCIKFTILSISFSSFVDA